MLFNEAVQHMKKSFYLFDPLLVSRAFAIGVRRNLPEVVERHPNRDPITCLQRGMRRHALRPGDDPSYVVDRRRSGQCLRVYQIGRQTVGDATVHTPLLLIRSG